MMNIKKLLTLVFAVNLFGNVFAFSSCFVKSYKFDGNAELLSLHIKNITYDFAVLVWKKQYINEKTVWWNIIVNNDWVQENVHKYWDWGDIDIYSNINFWLGGEFYDDSEVWDSDLPNNDYHVNENDYYVNENKIYMKNWQVIDYSKYLPKNFGDHWIVDFYYNGSNYILELWGVLKWNDGKSFVVVVKNGKIIYKNIVINSVADKFNFDNDFGIVYVDNNNYIFRKDADTIVKNKKEFKSYDRFIPFFWSKNNYFLYDGFEKIKDPSDDSYYKESKYIHYLKWYPVGTYAMFTTPDDGVDYLPNSRCTTDDWKYFFHYWDFKNRKSIWILNWNIFDQENIWKMDQDNMKKLSSKYTCKVIDGDIFVYSGDINEYTKNPEIVYPKNVKNNNLRAYSNLWAFKVKTLNMLVSSKKQDIVENFKVNEDVKSKLKDRKNYIISKYFEIEGYKFKIDLNITKRKELAEFISQWCFDNWPCNSLYQTYYDVEDTGLYLILDWKNYINPKFVNVIDNNLIFKFGSKLYVNGKIFGPYTDMKFAHFPFLPKMPVALWIYNNWQDLIYSNWTKKTYAKDVMIKLWYKYWFVRGPKRSELNLVLCITNDVIHKYTTKQKIEKYKSLIFQKYGKLIAKLPEQRKGNIIERANQALYKIIKSNMSYYKKKTLLSVILGLLWVTEDLLNKKY